MPSGATIPDAVRAPGDLDALLALDRLALSPSTHRGEGRFDRLLRRIGLPLGPILFAAILAMPLPSGLSPAGRAAMATFALALVWWIAEPWPTHVTSLATMVLLIVTRADVPTNVMGVFGLDVIWLNILAFILSAMLVRARLARRLALWLIRVFGRRASWALGAFVLLQLALAPLIPATAARTVLTLPLMLAMAAIYGASEERNTNFGRNLFLLNLVAISLLSSTVMTGSAANLMAVGFLQTLGGHHVYYSDWALAAAPVAIATVALAWLLGPRLLFPLQAEERTPVIAGGLEAVRRAERELGPLAPVQWRAIAIFALVLFLWASDRYQASWFGFELGAPAAAMIGATLALLPRIGVISWEETEIPWHLMIFSAGAYAGGLALERSGAAAWAVHRVFDGMALERVPFGVTYAAVLAIMLYSHLLSTSKTVRTVIMVPAIILLARGLGWDPVSLALPAAFTIDWVIGLPISGKPNVILFGTNQYSALDNLKYGLAVCTAGYVLLLIAGATWFHWLGITPAFGALP